MLIGDTYMYIENVSSEKDLVVTIDDNLNFSEHIALEVKQANQAIGMIRNTFTRLNTRLFLPLYKSFVRPHHEYAGVVRSPFCTKKTLLP